MNASVMMLLCMPLLIILLHLHKECVEQIVEGGGGSVKPIAEGGPGGQCPPAENKTEIVPHQTKIWSCLF